MSSTEKVKINFCAPRELMSLPGIGRSLCDTVLDLRESKGNIKLEDLIHIKHLQLSSNLLEKLDFEPYQAVLQASSESEVSKKNQNMSSRIDEAIASSNLRGPPLHYLTPPTSSNLRRGQGTTQSSGPPTSGYGPSQGYISYPADPAMGPLGQPTSGYGPPQGSTSHPADPKMGSSGQSTSGYDPPQGYTFYPADPTMGPSGQTPWGFGSLQRQTSLGATSPKYRQPCSDVRNEPSFGPVTSQSSRRLSSGSPQTVPINNYTPFSPQQSIPFNTTPSNAFQQTMPQHAYPPSLANVKIEPGYQALCSTPQFQNKEVRGQAQSCTGFDSPSNPASRQQSKSDWLPKSLYFDPTKPTWEAFYLKFQNYARDKYWSSEECKSKLMYVVEGKAAEFFAGLHEREPNLPFYDVVRRMETRFAF